MLPPEQQDLLIALTNRALTEAEGARVRRAKLERFGPGPWIDELDRLAFNCEDGFGRLIRRISMGTLAGYVLLPDEHAWSGRHYDLIPVEVHGGVTFAEPTRNLIGEYDPRFAVGFDCAHAWDLLPLLAKTSPDLYAREVADTDPFKTVYRDIAYVRTELELLALQAYTRPWAQYRARLRAAKSPRQKRQALMFALLHKRIANRRLPDSRVVRARKRAMAKRRVKRATTHIRAVR